MDRVVSDPLSWGEGAMKHKMMLQENSGGGPRVSPRDAGPQKPPNLELVLVPYPTPAAAA